MREYVLFALLLIILSAFYAFMSNFEVYSSESNIGRFSSYQELEKFVSQNSVSEGFAFGMRKELGGAEVMQTFQEESQTAKSGSASEGASEFSKTNIQVEGVDEADIVKTDGKYIYVISGNSVVILDAYPAEKAKIVSEINLTGIPFEMFLNKDVLVVIGNKRQQQNRYSSSTFINVYDVSDRSNPVLKRNVSVDGYYFDSRMINDYVYVISNEPVYRIGNIIQLPVIYYGGIARKVLATEIYYFNNPDNSFEFVNIISLNTHNNEEVKSKTFLMGYAQNMYVSVNNIYVVYQKRVNEIQIYNKIIDEAIIPFVSFETQAKIKEVQNSNLSDYEKLQRISKTVDKYLKSLGPVNGAKVMKAIQNKAEEMQKEILKKMEKTVIHKISVNNGNIEYKAKGEVPGRVLNQFSMDERNGYFRLATTTGRWADELSNHMYVLDDNLNVVGKLEDLASGERIYSVRFLGEKAYMVTFRQVDPLFVIDLSDPQNPKVLGYLKIEGVSDYLHPYDENHLIGIGKDATDKGVIKGMKVSLFDVSDFSSPKEISKYVIGERGTTSEALYDHKAFLFDKKKKLLVIPVRVAKDGKWNAFNGAYVFNIDLDNGILLKGNITHRNKKDSVNYDFYSIIRRSLYIDNMLYTVSQRMIKMNRLSDLSEVNSISLPYVNRIILELSKN